MHIAEDVRILEPGDETVAHGLHGPVNRVDGDGVIANEELIR